MLEAGEANPIAVDQVNLEVWAEGVEFVEGAVEVMGGDAPGYEVDVGVMGVVASIDRGAKNFDLGCSELLAQVCGEVGNQCPSPVPTVGVLLLSEVTGGVVVLDPRGWDLGDGVRHSGL